uniref:Uncharacterized protein n=1 Tax=Spongospora subterranea TaxID=70186 RepID=A0A0H5R4N0_9EUKA|eukprot:CRZ03034.1 hypothetical protein [Spongospora subterranea]
MHSITASTDDPSHILYAARICTLYANPDQRRNIAPSIYARAYLLNPNGNSASMTSCSDNVILTTYVEVWPPQDTVRWSIGYGISPGRIFAELSESNPNRNINSWIHLVIAILTSRAP